MNFSFNNQGTHTYLVYSVQPEDIIDTMCLGMITNNKISGLAHTLYTQVDSNVFIKYDVSAKITAKQFFCGPVNRKRLVGVFQGIVKALQSAEEYMIDSNAILLDLDYIFADVTTCETVLICLPLVSDDLSSRDLGAFFRNIMMSTQFDQTENCDYLAKIINYLNSTPLFSLDDFSHLLDSIAGTILTGEMVGQQPRVSTSGKVTVIGGAKESKLADNVQFTSKPQNAAVGTNSVSHPSNAGKEPVQQVNVTQNGYQNVAAMPSDMEGGPINGGSPIPNGTMGMNPVNNGRSGIPTPNADMGGVPNNGGIPTPPPGKNKEKKSLFGGMFSKKEKSPKKDNKSPTVTPGFDVPGQNNIPSQGQGGFAIPGGIPVGGMGSIPNGGMGGRSSGGEIPNVGMAGTPNGGMNGIPNNGGANSFSAVPKGNTGSTNFSQSSGNFGDTTVLSNPKVGETTVLVAPAAGPKKPVLIRMKNSEKISVDKPVFRIGKEKSYVDYFIGDNASISRSHANIVTREGEYFVVDTNSTNHTYVNGALIQSNVETKITNGTKIRFANEDFEFKLV